MSSSYPLPITIAESLEQILRLFEKALPKRTFVSITQLSEFLQFHFLCRREMSRHFNVDAHMQVAMAVTLNILHPLAFEPEHRPGLSAGRNFQGRFCVQGR